MLLSLYRDTQEQMIMKLGEKLAKTVAELEAAKIKALDAKAAADLAKIRKERETLNYFVDEFRQYLIDTITAEKNPCVESFQL
jgi:hypothetical protein